MATIQYSSIGIWLLRIIPAIILLQTLFFKFTAAEESVYIFSELGMEPWGRIGTGIMELVAAVLLLYPKTTAIGAFISIGLMVGAIGAHFIKLGIEVKNDGGLLFIYAVIVLISSITLLIIFRNNVLILLKSFAGK